MGRRAAAAGACARSRADCSDHLRQSGEGVVGIRAGVVGIRTGAAEQGPCACDCPVCSCVSC
jgi:hypothetical protein